MIAKCEFEKSTESGIWVKSGRSYYSKILESTPMGTVFARKVKIIRLLKKGVDWN